MIFCVIGPTCTGKSKVAEFISKTFNMPLINFDAFQVYREMDIGTAKPTLEELNSGRYFLYNIKNIGESFDVFNYQKEARKLLDINQNKDVVFVGGTGLYLKATLFDYKFKDEERMPENYLSHVSNDELFKLLEKIDPIDAQKIGINNRKRLLRALFIYEINGKTKSELNENGKNNLLYGNVVFIGINPPREELYKNINLRVDEMFNNGLENEVKNLFEKYPKSSRAFQGIGYKEFTLSNNVEEIKELIKKNTRNYAKRQVTFFKHQFENVLWFNSYDEAIDYVKRNY